MIVVFDLSGVVFSNGLKTAVKKISEEFNLEPEIVEDVLNGQFSKKYRMGEVSSSEFWKSAESSLKVGNIDMLRQIFFDSYCIKDDSVKLIKELRNNDVKVAFLSNSPEDRVNYLDEKYKFISLFDFGLFSFQAHAWKPDPEMFEEFLKRFGLKPNEIIYIDDKEENLVPAKKLGMRTILFEDAAQLKRVVQNWI
ncbi:MAG: HAD family phosphatase [Candidatus Aenigmatarchaeota archaeon]